MEPAYKLITSEADYRDACDAILARAEREILIFDRDLAAPQLNRKARVDALAAFLTADRLRRIRIVLHDSAALERDMPGLVQLFLRFSHAIEVRLSPDNLRHMADTHLLADGRHGVRRFHADQPRSAIIVADEAYIHPWRQRFEELWQLSRPYTGLATTGL